MFFRVSVFFYSKYSDAPYFTYYRGTEWFQGEEEPSREELEDLIDWTQKQAQEDAPEDATISGKPRIEVEEVDFDEVPSGWGLGPRLSKSEGDLPSEDYVRPRQTRLDAGLEDGDDA